MVGIQPESGEGKNPSDRNQFLLGPYRHNIDLELPQVRQKAERSYQEKEQAVAVEGGADNEVGTVVSYDAVARTGTVQIASGVVPFINVTKIATNIGDVVLITEFDLGYAMIGLLTHASQVLAPAFPSGILNISYPLRVDNISLPLEDSNYVLDVNGVINGGLETVLASDFGSGAVNGVSLVSGTNFSLGSPSGLSIGYPVGHASGHILVADPNPVLLAAWSPSTGWGPVTTTVDPIGVMCVDYETENSWFLTQETSTGYRNVYSAFGGSIVNHGRMGLPNSAMTFVYAGNGLLLWHAGLSAGNITLYAKTSTGLDNFASVGTAYFPTVLSVNYKYDYLPLNNSLVTCEQSTASTQGDIYTINLSSLVTTVYPDVVPLNFFTKSVAWAPNGGVYIAGFQETGTLPSPPGSYGATSVSFALYGFNGTSTSLLYYDHNLRTEAGTSLSNSANSYTSVGKLSRVNGELLLSTRIADIAPSGTSDETYLLRFTNL